MNFSKISVSAREVASLTITIIVGMFWISQTYMTKAEAEDQKKAYEQIISDVKKDSELKYEQLDKRISSVQDNTNSIARDVSFIRGQIESKRGKYE